MQMTTIAGIVGILLMLILMFAGVNLAFSFFISGFIGVVMILGFGGGLTYLQTIPEQPPCLTPSQSCPCLC